MGLTTFELSLEMLIVCVLINDFILLLYLIFSPSKSHLGSHEPLSLSHHETGTADAVSPAA